MVGIAAGVTVLDGGMGKELHRMGAPFRQPEWSALALWEAPEMVAEAHRRFIDAGAEVIITNTYALVPYHIGRERYAADGEALMSLAARIAREVADEADRPVLVAGSIPPLFGSYQPANFDRDAAPAMYRSFIDSQAPYVDLWIAETLGSLAEFSAVGAAAADDPHPFWAGFSLQKDLVDGRAQLYSCETVADAARAAAGRADALLFNCAPPEVMGPAIIEVRDTLGADFGGLRIGAYPNAFPDDITDGYAPNENILGRRGDLTEARLADLAEEWVALGATIAGGCCGMHPEHIAAVAERLRQP